ncbi:MAG TPA: mannose-1-phosphate guanylyltransferase/mannose-6-phosphate isomerase [Alphaproteobacteria bacterium]|nr:mannose-1-phosphate guanylyltransferase/mannose-6-phosphate isomerase [Alphaproteobacteria bacterium]
MIVPVILSGGSGTRLWPLSRLSYPKQFLKVGGGASLLQQTALRVGEGFAPPIAVSNEEQRFLIAHHLLEAGLPPAKILLEPASRNTAPATAAACLYLARADDPLLLVLPADHVIRDERAFRKAVAAAEGHARDGHLVIFGVRPDRPHTGYGYIEAGRRLDSDSTEFPGHLVHRFVEKPDAAAARSYVDSGNYYWNAGIFLFRAGAFLRELGNCAPAILAACREAVDRGSHDGDFFRFDATAFGRAPALSIDYAVMEKTEAAVVVPVEMGWSDVGSWSALWEVGEKDDSGNVVEGEALLQDVAGAYIRSDGPLVAGIGFSDMVVVATEDAVLVAPKERAQEVRAIVDRLKSSGRTEHATHRLVHRPWGSYRTISLGSRYQVKEIIVKPGASLSLQKHHHRAEHWVVVEGTASVTRGEESLLLHENQSIFIPLGAKHRLANPGKLPLRLIEVQSGSYLGEDDIVRFEDDYGRAR